MQKRLEKITTQRSWIVSITLTLFLFLLVNVCATPLLNSGDDTFFMYTLAGGYGEAPTALLQYNYGWHLWLGGVIKNLFVVCPGINWYTICLLFFHGVGCTALCYVLLKRLKIVLAFFFFSAFFFFIETRLLLSLNYTGAAFVAAVGASALLLYQLQKNKLASGNTLLAILFLLLAGMLRMQIVLAVLFLITPAAVTLLKKQSLINWVAVSVIIAVGLLGFNSIHEKYYKQHIEGWQQQEEFRQALFYTYNRSLKTSSLNAAFTDSTEQQLFFAGFLYDSSKFTSTRIKAISKKITRKRWMNDPEDWQALFWLFIEMRIYILLFGIIILSLLMQQKYVPVKKWLLSFLTVAATYGYLFVFLKVTITIYLGLLLVLWMHLAFHLNRDTYLLPQNKKGAIGLGISFLILLGWMSIRITKENKTNLGRRQKFLCATAELNQYPQNLFVATDDTFPLNYFYLWDVPAQYPVKNLLYKDRLLSHSYLHTLKRFKISNLQNALLHNKNVFLLGRPLPAVTGNNLSIKISVPVPVYHCVAVRQLTIE